jgi:PAS domain S-box-containing protein
MEQHRLLQKQIQKFLPPHVAEDEAFKNFLEAVSDSYQIFERDKSLSDNAFDISEKEYRTILENLTIEYAEKKKAIDRVTHLIKKVDSQFPFQNDEISSDLETILSFLENKLEKIIQLEKELQKNEERFKLAIEGSSDGIWDYDIVEQKLFLSDHLLVLIGQTPEDKTPLIEQLFNWIHPDDVEISKQTFINHIKSKVPIELIVRVKNKQGTYKYFLVRGNSLWNNSNRAFRTAGSLTDFTERILLQEEQRLTNEVAEVGSWQMSLDDQQLYFSTLTREIFECSEKTIIDLDFLLSLIEENDRGVLREALISCIQKHTPFDLELQCSNNKWVRLKGETLWENNTPVKIFGIARNITERKNLEASLLASEQNLRGILDSTDTGYVLLDNNFYIIHINKTLIQFAETNQGMLPNLLKPKNYYLNTLPNERKPIVEKELKKVLEGKSISYEVDYLQKDGTVKNYLSKLFPIAFENNKSNGIVISIQDISHIKQAEEALKNSEERFRSLVSNISDLILLINKDGILLYQSDSVEKILGYSPDYSIGKYIQEFIHPDDFTKSIDLFWNSLNLSGTSQFFETRLLHKDGHYIYVEAQGNNQWRNPSIEGIIIVARNITERKLVEQELQNKSKLLEATAKVSIQLASDKHWLEVLQSAMGEIGLAIKADRVYLFENTTDAQTGEKFSFQVLEWTSREDLKQIDNENLQHLPIKMFSPFFKPLLNNEPFIGHTSEMEDGPGKELLLQQEIKSIILLPIFVNKEFHGLIGLDACFEKREWTTDEISVLQLLAKTIGSSFENKQYKIELETSNQRYIQVSKATSDAIWEIDLVEKNNLHWSGGYEKLFGHTITNKPIDLKDWYNNIHPTDRDETYNSLLEFIEQKNQQYWFSEYRYKKADNTYSYVIDRGLLIFDETQTAVKMVGAMQDVTVQKKQSIEKELILQISALIAQQESVENGLLQTIEEVGKYLEAQEAFAWLINIDETTLILKSQWCSESISHERKNRIISIEDKHPTIIQQCWKSKQIIFEPNAEKNKFSHNLAIPIFHSDKVIAVILFHFENEPVFNLNESNSFLKEIALQIGESLQSKKIEEELNHFFNISPDLLCIIGPDGYFKKVNPAFRDLLGYSDEDLLNNSFTEWIHFEDLNKTQQALITPSKKQETSYLENRMIASNGELKWLAWTAIFDVETELRYAVAKDITEKIKLSEILDKERSTKINEVTNAALTAQENERQELGRELHDNINQILVSCRLYLSLIKISDTEQLNYLKMTDGMIKDAIKELRQLSHTLLPATLSDSNLVKALDNIFQTAIKSGVLEVAKDFSGFNQNNLSDHIKLNIYRIIQEQFNNILKHAKATRVYVRLANNKETIELEISDNGLGAEIEKSVKGVGITNIRSRASLFSGEVHISTSPGDGFNLRVILHDYI